MKRVKELIDARATRVAKNKSAGTLCYRPGECLQFCGGTAAAACTAFYKSVVD